MWDKFGLKILNFWPMSKFNHGQSPFSFVTDGLDSGQDMS